MTLAATAYRFALAGTLLLAPPAQAAEPMTAAEFESYTTGKTLTYAASGQPYGIEQYLTGRRVQWAYLGDECRLGSWYEQGPLICFVYDGPPDGPQCWTFFNEPGGLRARFEGSDLGSELIEVEQTSDPMACPGPNLGV